MMFVSKRVCFVFLFFIVIFLIVGFSFKREKMPLRKIPKAYDYDKKLVMSAKPHGLVSNNILPSIVSDKTIYLTFDDGPSSLTSGILDILERENIPATFFIIGTHLDEYRDVIIRSYLDGNTIALHSNTHDYKYIYTSEDNYYNDLRTLNNRLFSITGHRSRILRFPGGSSNTVSKKYNNGIMTRLTDKMNDNDYYYFDWNVDSTDASGQVSADKIYKSVTDNLRYSKNIVLMHDSAVKKTTLEALDAIIKFGKQHGYTFARIDKDTINVHHHLNN